MEQKSDSIQNFVTQLVQDKIEIGHFFFVETPSFVLNYFKLNAENFPSEISIKNSSTFKLPPACQMFDDADWCKNKNILIKVMRFVNEMRAHIFRFKATFFLKHTSIPMAVSGHNGNNETLIGMSASIGLSFYDENTSEIKVAKSQSPIKFIIPRGNVLLNETLTFQYVNATQMQLSSSFLTNGFTITTSNASIHIELKPLNRSVGYLIVMKLGYTPVINSTHADFTSFKLFCPSKFWFLF